MKEMITDMHTHSAFSHDGKAELKTMLAAARRRGVVFYGVCEHFDYDYDESLLPERRKTTCVNAEPSEYFHAARHLQEDYEGVMNVAIGAEFGFGDGTETKAKYAEIYQKFHLDYVVNSVHSRFGVDYARGQDLGEKSVAYSAYLDAVRRSLDVPYPYDVVAHFGYVARYAKFADVDFDMAEFGEKLDDIFLTIIKKGKILEVNTATKTLAWGCVPNAEMLQRYYALGGRKIVFGSDAHAPDRIADKWAETVEMLKKIGFTHLTVPFRGEEILVELPNDRRTR